MGLDMRAAAALPSPNSTTVSLAIDIAARKARWMDAARPVAGCGSAAMRCCRGLVRSPHGRRVVEVCVSATVVIRAAGAPSIMLVSGASRCQLALGQTVPPVDARSPRLRRGALSGCGADGRVDRRGELMDWADPHSSYSDFAAMHCE